MHFGFYDVQMSAACYFCSGLHMRSDTAVATAKCWPARTRLSFRPGHCTLTYRKCRDRKRHPLTGAGKRSLPPPLRNRFTEVWVAEPSERADLLAVAAACLAGAGGAAAAGCHS